MAMKISSVVKVVALVFCFGSLFLAQSGTEQGEMRKVEKKHIWELGCLFKFNDFAEIFLINEEPLKLLYSQDLRTYGAFDTEGRKGEMLITFKDGAFFTEGLGFQKKDTKELLQERDEHYGDPQKTIDNKIACNLFPRLYWQALPLYKCDFLRNITVDKKYGGDVIIKVEKQEKSEKFIMNIKTSYDMVSSQICPEMAQSIGGQVEYDTGFSAGSPFIIATTDLDGDGLKEIVIGQGWYKTKAIFIWSRTPRNFLKLNEIAEKIWGFTDWENPEAKANCGLFEKGKITKITLQN